MRKYKFRKQSVKELFKKNGFKAALAISIVGLGIAAYQLFAKKGEKLGDSFLC